jgi:hypothetical protein
MDGLARSSKAGEKNEGKLITSYGDDVTTCHFRAGPASAQRIIAKI